MQNQYALQNNYYYGGYLDVNESSVGFSQSEDIKAFTLQSIENRNRYVAVNSENKVKVFKVNVIFFLNFLPQDHIWRFLRSS